MEVEARPFQASLHRSSRLQADVIALKLDHGKAVADMSMEEVSRV